MTKNDMKEAAVTERERERDIYSVRARACFDEQRQISFTLQCAVIIIWHSW